MKLKKNANLVYGFSIVLFFIVLLFFIEVFFLTELSMTTREGLEGSGYITPPPNVCTTYVPDPSGADVSYIANTIIKLQDQIDDCGRRLWASPDLLRFINLTKELHNRLIKISNEPDCTNINGKWTADKTPSCSVDITK